MEGGDMAKIILDKNGDFSEDFCRWTLYQVALGLQHMHARNVLHRDIKNEKILCRPNGEVKIKSTSYSTVLSKEVPRRQTQKGNIRFGMSPEWAKGVSYSKEVDIWAFGCFAYELATGKRP